ncbi:hypothetical protein AVEN_134753-1 [Araneus ventricosus]|uniref:Uncharacterized protein n=1 Tax=Araneus ventricosus TaxID=182803 RepID=A0A4Y2SEF0_ARAVE|nr:hypothetical protein AVEN_134753-1 [Araneus ventricosus]
MNESFIVALYIQELTPLVLLVASSWQGGVPGRSERSTSGVYTPERIAQGVKVTPLFPANTNRHGVKTVFYLSVLRSSDYRGCTFPPNYNLILY